MKLSFVLPLDKQRVMIGGQHEGDQHGLVNFDSNQFGIIFLVTCIYSFETFGLARTPSFSLNASSDVS